MPEASPTASAGLVARLIGRTGGTAILDPTGAHDYATLVDASAAIATDLLRGLGDRSDLGGVRVAFLVPPGAGWAATLYGIWRAGGVAVPLALGWPAPELQHAIEETGAGTILATSELESRIADIASRLGVPRRTLQRTDELPAVLSAPPPSGRPEGLPTVPSERAAMILFTSGTTSRPKGVVHTHGSIAAQVDTLVEAWAWSESDRLLHVLPLHHVHGIVNGLLCALASGATCDLLPEFDAETVWRAFVERPVTLFMAVPTVYARLIAAWEDAGPSDRAVRSEATARQRVMISGSAPLPVPLLERWERIAGQRLLERYGMTEIGMALSNPLEGERRPGTVGFPLPGISVRLVDESGRPVEREGEPGEIEVAGPTVFREYWRRPAATGSAFRDGWFVTGDEATIEDGYWRILGRRSVDIVKTGGEKVSALEVESVLCSHPAVAACAVVGVSDPDWGERVAAAVVTRSGAALDLDRLRSWAKERLAVWKIPTRLEIVDELPRNAMGKVVKADIRSLFEESTRKEPR